MIHLHCSLPLLRLTTFCNSREPFLLITSKARTYNRTVRFESCLFHGTQKHAGRTGNVHCSILVLLILSKMHLSAPMKAYTRERPYSHVFIFHCRTTCNRSSGSYFCSTQGWNFLRLILTFIPNTQPPSPPEYFTSSTRGDTCLLEGEEQYTTM